MRKIKVGNLNQDVYFTSDTHFRHKNVIEYCNRPFSSVEEMDEVIIRNWNQVVGPRDVVFHLGDFIFHQERNHTKQVEETNSFLHKLNGHKHLILGNHDKRGTFKSELWDSIDDMLQIECFGEQSIVLCHYAMMVWDKSHYGSFALHAHSHGTLGTKVDFNPAKDYILSMYNFLSTTDIGVDCWEFYPISYSIIKEFINYKRSLASFWLNNSRVGDAKEISDELDQKRRELIKRVLS